MGKKLTQEEFEERANSIHNGKYTTYGTYINGNTTINILCPIHGWFAQNAERHLRGQGCPKCGGSECGTIESFIKKAKQVHGDKYNYSNVKYINNKTKVCIICPVHGEFWQTPHNHLKPRGCNVCGEITRVFKRKLTPKGFENRAKSLHGDKFDYSKVEYMNSKTKVCIICKRHGEFQMTPSNHLLGKGCPKCKAEKNGERCRTNISEFIVKANEIHNHKYDYNKVDYIDTHTKVKIVCPHHGEFWQRPSDHLRGQGCPNCSCSKLEIEIYNFLLENKIGFKEQYKAKWLGLQTIDFYLPDYNAAIECQGGQHFKIVDHFGGEEGFVKCVHRDQVKLKKCKDNGVKLLYYSNLGIDYPYHVFEDKELLLEEIKKCGTK